MLKYIFQIVLPFDLLILYLVMVMVKYLENLFRLRQCSLRHSPTSIVIENGG